MATELSLLSMSQIQNLDLSLQSSRNIQLQGNLPNPRISASYSDYIWNPRGSHLPDDDSWEVRAFAEDNRNVFGSTWPPRSYTCTFCRREFRSAQALGGHMNVHRRDRARLHQSQSQPATSMNFNSSPNTSSFLVPTQELGEDQGLCLFYTLPPTSSTSPTTVPKSTTGVSSMLLSFSPHQTNTVILPSSTRCAVSPTEANSSYRYSSKPHKASPSSHKGHEELDLELRL